MFFNWNILLCSFQLCIVQKGQLKMKKLTENQTAQMVKNAARPPAERRQTIENCIKDIKYNQDPVLKEFGIDVHEQFATIPGRVLDQPSLAYYQNRVCFNCLVERLK